MSDIVLDATTEDGSVQQDRVPHGTTVLLVCPVFFFFFFFFFFVSLLCRFLVGSRYAADAESAACCFVRQCRAVDALAPALCALLSVSCRFLTPSLTAPQQRFYRNTCGCFGLDATGSAERESLSPASVVADAVQLAGNRLVAVPRQIYHLRVLRELYVSRSTVHVSLADCLQLNRNEIERLPRELGLLSALEYLSVGMVVVCVASSHRLRQLGDNALTSLPSGLGRLQSLKEVQVCLPNADARPGFQADGLSSCNATVSLGCRSRATSGRQRHTLL